jgi:hypothetical protein
VRSRQRRARALPAQALQPHRVLAVALLERRLDPRALRPQRGQDELLERVDAPRGFLDLLAEAREVELERARAR